MLHNKHNEKKRSRKWFGQKFGFLSQKHAVILWVRLWCIIQLLLKCIFHFVTLFLKKISDLKVGKYETLIDSPTWQKDLHVQSYFQFKGILFNKLPARLNQITPEQKSDIAENCLHLRSCDAKISETTWIQKQVQIWCNQCWWQTEIYNLNFSVAASCTLLWYLIWIH